MRIGGTHWTLWLGWALGMAWLIWSLAGCGQTNLAGSTLTCTDYPRGSVHESECRP